MCPAGERRAGARGFCTRDEAAFQEKNWKLSSGLQEQHLANKLGLQSYETYVSVTVLTIGFFVIAFKWVWDEADHHQI